MSNVYEKCPVLENDKFVIRLIDEKDAKDLFLVYSDKNVLPFLNSDNCHGSNFYCEKEEYVLESIKYWKIEYANRGFVRFSIVDKTMDQVIGTIELFNRKADDYFTDCGLMRIDVRNDHENKEALKKILDVIVAPSFELFSCDMIATKAPIYAVERIEALKDFGFKKTEECLVGQDGWKYHDYWVIHK
ncbi:hypothetical protein lbkm_1977 [Lachnospiraceae bacterium KM106-2]|nr:hypothetical protein lbkm_1977 [Lachnospiraceae bacterium KM106-2]